MSSYTKQVMPAKLRLPIKAVLMALAVCSLLLCAHPFIRLPTLELSRFDDLDRALHDLEHDLSRATHDLEHESGVLSGLGTVESPLTALPQQCVGVEPLRAARTNDVREAADLDLVSR